MTKEELIKRLRFHEWDDFEVKEAKNRLPKDIWKTVSAFANTEGGYIVLGIQDKGKGDFEISGLGDVEKLQSDFLTTLRGEKFNIQLSSKGHLINVDEKQVLSFKINSMPGVCKPIYYGGDIRNSYIRQGSGDQKCSREEINRMLREASELSSDSMIMEGYNIDNIDIESIDIYRKYLRLKDPESPFLLLEVGEFLKKLGCIAVKQNGNNDELTMAGLLLFGNEDSIRTRFPSYELDIYLVPGDDMVAEGTIWQDRKIYEENLIRTYLSAINYLKGKVEIPFAFAPDGITRTEEVPIVIAIREALVNMLIHRDYFDNTQSRIKIFPRKIEMFNPGSSPKSIEEIIENSITVPRNPVIAKVFRLVGWSEIAGSGMMKIFNNLKKIGYKKPVIENSVPGYFFKITFLMEEENIYIRRIQNSMDDSVIESLNESINNSINEPVKLTEAQKKIIDEIRYNKKITYDELASLMGRDKATIRRNIRKLKDLKIVKRIGSNKNGCWDILISEELDAPVNASVNASVKLTGLQESILEEMDRNKNVTYVEIAGILGKNKATIRRNIKKLKDLGVIKRKGSDKNGHWEVLQPDISGSKMPL